MELGEVKLNQLIAAGIVILLLSVIGFWVYSNTERVEKKQVQVQEVEVEVQEPAETPAVSNQPVFQPLGESSIAIKIPESAVFQQDSILNTPAGYSAFIVSNDSTVISVKVKTLASTIEGEEVCEEVGCLSEMEKEEFQRLQDAFQQGVNLEEYERRTINNRVYYYQQKEVQLRVQETYYSFFGDTFLVEVSHLNDTNSELPSGPFEQFMNDVSFTSRFFSRHALEQIFIKLFAEKNLLDLSAVTIQTLWATENHARGELTLETTSGSESGIFFGVKDENEWKLIFEGNGRFKCSVLTFHAFPEPMQDGCR